MSTRASGRLIEAHFGAVNGSNRGLKDVLNENELYEDVID
jgi:hypothetical protein